MPPGGQPCGGREPATESPSFHAARSFRCAGGPETPLPSLGGAARRGTRPGGGSRGSSSGDAAIRDELLELPGLGGTRVPRPPRDGRARAQRPAGVRAASAAAHGRDRSQLLRPDPRGGPRALRRAAAAGISLLREGTGSRDVAGPRRSGARRRPQRTPTSSGRNASSRKWSSRSGRTSPATPAPS